MIGDDKKHPTGMARVRSSHLDSVLNAAIPLLDDGFVRVVDYMGDDSAIVQAARISYGSGTKRIQSDRGLIRYLMRHSHTTPFEMCEIKLHVRAPMDVWRQWIRHRTANVNEYSTRYSIAIDATQTTPPNAWRRQSTGNRQGSDGFLPASEGEALSETESSLQSVARRVYKERLDAGVAREQARKDLPLSTYTEAYWKIDLHNLFNFLNLRMRPQAQEEIRLYANAIGRQLVANWVPVAWEAFVEYRLEALQLSRTDIDVISAIISKSFAKAKEIAQSKGMLEAKQDGTMAPSRERNDLEKKLSMLGLHAPWKR